MLRRVPPVHSSVADVVAVIIFRAAFDYGSAEGDIDPSLRSLPTLALGSTSSVLFGQSRHADIAHGVLTSTYMLCSQLLCVFPRINIMSPLPSRYLSGVELTAGLVGTGLCLSKKSLLAPSDSDAIVGSGPRNFSSSLW